MITEPTHFTERSSSLIDIIMVSNPNRIILSGEVDPFENQFHCPIFTKPHKKLSEGISWKYKAGDYENLKQLFHIADWNLLQMKTLTCTQNM